MDMRFSRFLATVAAMCGLLLSCEGENPILPEGLDFEIPEEFAEIIASGIDFNASEDGSGSVDIQGPVSQTVSFTAPFDWSTEITDITKASSWLSVDPANGSAGEVEMTVTAQPNTSESPREASVSITCGESSLSFTVRQAGVAPPERKYLSFTSEGTTTISMSNAEGCAPVLYYSKDAQNWTQWDYSGLEFTSDSPLYICGDNPEGFCHLDDEYIYFSQFVSSGDNFGVSGSIMSLLDPYQEASVIPTQYCFALLFKNCTGLTTAPTLPATTLVDHCYYGMFRGCTSLNYVKCLATDISASNCTYEWLDGVSKRGTFVKAEGVDWPSGPSGIPSGWTVKIDGQGEEPITASKYLTFTSEGTTTISLANYYTAPILFYSTDAQNWTQWNYSELVFTKDSPLYLRGDNPEGITHPNYEENCLEYSWFYSSGDRFGVSGNIMSLLNSDTDLLTVPSEYCFAYLFFECSNLISAPDLPATTLANYCYLSMFEGCTNLPVAPALPASTLAVGCYYRMFFNCTNLIVAPELTAATLTPLCYGAMFNNCNSLNHIKCLATDISANNCTIEWLNDVSNTGTFIKASGVHWPYGSNGIPYGWITQTDGQEEEPISASKYLTFTSEGTTTISFLIVQGDGPLLYYSTNAQDWIPWNFSELTFTRDAPLYICGNNPEGLGDTDSTIRSFVSSGDCFGVSGDIMSLVNKDEDVSVIPSAGFFKYLFNECLNLTKAPELPATTLTEKCYYGMFYGCKSLTSAPELPATTLEHDCYHAMFRKCVSLSSAPALPATTLASGCYSYMFYGCSGLLSAPVLPAKSLVKDCYICMFSGCKNLNYVKCLATDISADHCTENWLVATSETGTFVKSAGVDWPFGGNGIPYGWITQTDGQEEEPISASKYLTFTSEGTTRIELINENGNAPLLYYSTDAQNWEKWDYSTLTFTKDTPLYMW